MKALTLYEPWASLVMIGAKTFETRGWGGKGSRIEVRHRGELAIHAGKRVDKEVLFAPYVIEAFLKGGLLVDAELAGWASVTSDGWEWPLSARKSLVASLPLGKIVCVTDLVNVFSTNMEDHSRWHAERWFGDYSPNRFAWELKAVRRLREPIPTRGFQTLWNVPPQVVSQLSFL